jgi:hypothetical protein
MPHAMFTLFTAVLVSAALAMGGDLTPRERLYAAARTFCYCAASIVGGGWLMYLIHG